MISIGKRRSSLRDLDHLRIEPGIEMPGYCQCVALRRPNALCPRSSTANCHWPVLAHGHQLGLCRGARPSRLLFPASRPPSSRRDNWKLARHAVSGSRHKTKSVLKGRRNPSSFQDGQIYRIHYQPLRSWLISIASLRDSAAFAFFALKIHPSFAPFVHPKLPLPRFVPPLPSAHRQLP